MAQVTFGVVASAADAPGTSDADIYRSLLDDVEYNAELGFRTVWLIEHHFSDYFPTPSPLILASHIAGRFPELSLGTCVVVLPWYEPLRLAGEIAMLSLLTQQPLHLGIGRGTAKYEFDAFGLDMGASRERFREVYDVISTALKGQPFAYHGELIDMPKEVAVRPRVAGVTTDRIHFYGAIGSPGSASVMAELGLPPMCTTIGDLDTQAGIIRTWDETARAHGFATEVMKPIMINCIVADTDEEAIRLAQLYIPRFMQAQIDHYTPEETELGAVAQLPGLEGTVRRHEGQDRPGEHSRVGRVSAGRLPGNGRAAGTGVRRHRLQPSVPAHRHPGCATRRPARMDQALHRRGRAPVHRRRQDGGPVAGNGDHGQLEVTEVAETQTSSLAEAFGPKVHELAPAAAEILASSLTSTRPNAHLLPVEEARRNFDADHAALGKGEDVAAVREHRVPVDGGEIAVREFRPSTDTLPAVVYFHGGGWLLGSLDSHQAVCRALANASQAAVFSVDYRRGPEARFPTAVNDAYVATKWVNDHAGELDLVDREAGRGGRQRRGQPGHGGGDTGARPRRTGACHAGTRLSGHHHRPVDRIR